MSTVCFLHRIKNEAEKPYPLPAYPSAEAERRTDSNADMLSSRSFVPDRCADMRNIS